jgi:MFS family permease
MWELYAMWTWIAAFAAASLAGTGGSSPSTGSLVAFVAIASGAVGCMTAGVWADRFGKAVVAGASMAVSGICALIAGTVFGLPLIWMLLFAAIWGFSVVSDSAQFSALVAEHSPRTHVGTALTLQMCLGFLLTMASMRMIPAAAGAIGWQWVFVTLVPGPWLGVLAMRRLRG